MDTRQLESLRDHIDARLDRLEDKQDRFIERISTTETDVIWLKGHARIAMTILLTALSGAVAVIYNYLAG